MASRRRFPGPPRRRFHRWPKSLRPASRPLSPFLAVAGTAGLPTPRAQLPCPRRKQHPGRQVQALDPPGKAFVIEGVLAGPAERSNLDFSIRRAGLGRSIGGLGGSGPAGSGAGGTAGVGSDLDLLLILQRCDEPIWNRLRRWDTGSLPLACDLLVYSLEEWRSLPQWNPKLAEGLLNDTRWLGAMPDGVHGVGRAAPVPGRWRC